MSTMAASRMMASRRNIMTIGRRMMTHDTAVTPNSSIKSGNPIHQAVTSKNPTLPPSAPTPTTTPRQHYYCGGSRGRRHGPNKWTPVALGVGGYAGYVYGGGRKNQHNDQTSKNEGSVQE